MTDAGLSIHNASLGFPATKAALEKFGLKFTRGGANISRTMTLAELDTMLDSVPVGSTPADYREAVLKRSILGKTTESFTTFRGCIMRSCDRPLPLMSPVQAAATIALERLFPQFSEANHANWGQVVTRARAGDVGALSLVGYSGGVTKHPVCRRVLDFIGAGESSRTGRSTTEEGAGDFVFAKVGPFCRKGLSPQGEPVRRAVHKTGRFWLIDCTQVAACRKVPLGKRDLLELCFGTALPLTNDPPVL